MKNGSPKQLNQTRSQETYFYITSEGVKRKINEMVGGKDGQRFITSIISAVSTNNALAACDQGTILSAAMLGESLKLSPSPQLGQYYMVPYDQKEKRDKQGNIVQHAKKVAQFQLGYKGYIQLAEKSGQYKKLNVVSIKEGELVKFDPLNEEIEVNLIEDEEEREEAKTIGYYAMFEYLNGFRKAIYWSKKKMEKHADRYSKAFNLSVYEKINTGVIPAKDLWKYSSFWYKDFDGMAHKTMLRQLISKWGIMSIEMQTAFEKDMTVIDEDGNAEYVDNIEYEADSDYIEMTETEDIQEAAMTEHEESDDAQITILPNEAEDEVFSEDDFFNTEV